MSNSSNVQPTAANIQIAQGHGWPGERVVDSELIARAVREINVIAKTQADQLVKYLVDTFFGGDIANYNPRQDTNVTFAALCGRSDELDVSYSWLCKILSVARMEPSLPEAARTLTLSCKVLLLTVQNEQQRNELAAKAAAEHWSKRRLEAEIENLRGAGRTPPAVTRARFRKQIAAVVEFINRLPVVADITRLNANLPESVRRDLNTGINAAIQRLQEIVHLIGATNSPSVAPSPPSVAPSPPARSNGTASSNGRTRPPTMLMNNVRKKITVRRKLAAALPKRKKAIPGGKRHVVHPKAAAA